MKNHLNIEEFDSAVPSSGHEQRFERKLNETFSLNRKKFKWPKFAAAAVILVLLGSSLFLWPKQDNGVQKTADKVRNEIPVKEAELYYEQTFQKQIQLIAANYTSTESREMIEECQQLIKDLEKEYQELDEVLLSTGDQRVAAAMINNYKNRIKILEKLIQELNYVNHQKIEKNENNAS